MVEKMSTYILDNILYKGENISGDERDIMMFGIMRIVEDIPKYLFIFLLGLILNVLPYLGIVLIITALYKSFVGGAHASTNIECFIFSTIYFMMPILIAKYVNIPMKVTYIMYLVNFIFSIFVILKIVPGDTAEVPILKRSRRNKLKVLSSISLISIYIISLIFLKDGIVQNMIVITLMEINIFATNISYKLLRCKHSYEEAEYKQYFNS